MSYRRSNIVKALVAIILICLFAYFSVKTAEEFQKKQFDKVEAAAKKRGDSAIATSNKLQKEIKILTKQVEYNSKKIDHNSDVLDNSIETLKNIKHEKDYIGNPTIKQQSDFLSNYHYREFNGKAGK